MLSNINLNLLRSLHVLLDECHVSRAAERLHITQSAMSRQLAQLRELCGDPLLVRDGNRLVPTARALTLQSKLLGLLDEFEHLFSAPSFVPEQWQGEFVSPQVTTSHNIFSQRPRRRLCSKRRNSISAIVCGNRAI